MSEECSACLQRLDQLKYDIILFSSIKTKTPILSQIQGQILRDVKAWAIFGGAPRPTFFLDTALGCSVTEN